MTDALPLGVSRDVWVTIPRQQYNRLQATMSVENLISAPIAAGATLGQVVVKLDEEIIQQVPLVSLSAVEEGGIWTRLVDSLMLRFQ